MKFCNINNDDPNKIDYLAIAIDGFMTEQRHVGVIINSKSADAQFCHLGWHYVLRQEAIANSLVWVDCPLPTQVKKNFVAFLQLVMKANSPKGVPYSFADYKDSFNKLTGEYINRKLGSGLTCATFILSIFETINSKLVEIDQWPVRTEDIDWQKRILTALIAQMYHLNPDWRPSLNHILGMQKSIGSKRVKPEETMAAATQTTIPLQPDLTIAHGSKILAQLRECYT